MLFLALRDPKFLVSFRTALKISVVTNHWLLNKSKWIKKMFKNFWKPLRPAQTLCPCAKNPNARPFWWLEPRLKLIARELMLFSQFLTKPRLPWWKLTVFLQFWTKLLVNWPTPSFCSPKVCIGFIHELRTQEGYKADYVFSAFLHTGFPYIQQITINSFETLHWDRKVGVPENRKNLLGFTLTVVLRVYIYKWCNFSNAS